MDIYPPSRDEARDERGRIRPGFSGNPAGRPPLPPDIRAALEAGSVRAAQRLVELLESSDERVVATVANSILDRLHGKPAVVADVTTRQDDIGQTHIQVLQEILQRRRERLGEPTG